MTIDDMRANGILLLERSQKLSNEGADTDTVGPILIIGCLWQVCAEICERLESIEDEVGALTPHR